MTFLTDMHEFSDILTQGKDGIWYAEGNPPVSYPTEGNEQYFALEDKSFWFNHRNGCIVSAVKNFSPPGNGAIFDIGGGNGFVSAGLSAAGFETVLVEPGSTGVNNAQKRGIRNIICATTETAHFKPHSLPAIGLFDVIEHVENDSAFLRSIHMLLKNDGMLYATVPAFSFLWSEEDVLAGHYRRYSLRSITNLLHASGFEVIFSSYIFCFLPLPVFLLRTLPYKLGFTRGINSTKMAREHATNPGIVSSLIRPLLKNELRAIATKRSLRFGGSCLMVARPSIKN